MQHGDFGDAGGFPCFGWEVSRVTQMGSCTRLLVECCHHVSLHEKIMERIQTNEGHSLLLLLSAGCFHPPYCLIAEHIQLSNPLLRTPRMDEFVVGWHFSF